MTNRSRWEPVGKAFLPPFHEIRALGSRGEARQGVGQRGCQECREVQAAFGGEGIGLVADVRGPRVAIGVNGGGAEVYLASGGLLGAEGGGPQERKKGQEVGFHGN